MGDSLRRRWFPWATFAVSLVLLGPLSVVTYALVPKPGDAGVNCGGIGFGEQPCGWDAVGLTYIFFVAPYVVVFAIVLAVSEAFGTRATFVRSMIALVGASSPWVLALVSALSG